MVLTILSDDQIRFLLENLTRDELESFATSLRATLHEYSTGTQNPDDSSIHQPVRTSVYSAHTGATTLFMPSCSAAGLGVKVITLSSAEDQETPPQRDGRGGDSTSAGLAPGFYPPSSGDPSPSIPSGASPSLGRSSVDGSPLPATTAAAARPPAIRPTGAVTLFHPDGRPAGILHASTLTAFRTALASAYLVARRQTVRTVTVFGTGEQAFWHVRLALLLRGRTLRQVNIVNRRFGPSCREILRRLHAIDPAVKAREGWGGGGGGGGGEDRGGCEFSVLAPSYGDFARLLREQVRRADVVFCCTPATEPLFDADVLTSREARRKGRLLVAVGSYTPRMRELPAELLRRAARPHEQGRHHWHRHALDGGVVVVDTLDGALKEAGEIIEAGLLPNQLVELGELVMIQQVARSRGSTEGSADSSGRASPEFERPDVGSAGSPSSSVFGNSSGGGGYTGDSSAASSIRAGNEKQARQEHQEADTPTASSRSSSTGGGKKSVASFFRLGSHRRGRSGAGKDQAASPATREEDDRMARWLQEGNVIYKSVGMGLMDLTVGMHLIRFAREKGVGVHVEGF